MPDRIVPALHCDQCRRVVAEIDGENLVITERHDRETHQTVIPIAELTQSLKTGS
ncbi:MAG: hypothetical protein Q8R28_18125 [Dehalococcoidia bacterium]|nr:hypothetical protein [Dehalococcoidia bacterium]